MDPSREQIEALSAAVPGAVREVCSVLRGAGHQALTVGGAVRDVILGRPAGDWDVTTSAHPEAVMKLFGKVFPTGVEHGTVTVVLGRGKGRETIEVTAFRGEGEYSDARRPDHVRFGVPLEEDLARRDFVINAMAFDPIDAQLVDPFGGLDDIRARIIRAVGVPLERFTEDGLRIMRAVRFAATLEFDLDPATEKAIPAALESLDKVSRERVHVEMTKLLAAPRPSLGLAVALRTDTLERIIPALVRRSASDWDALLPRLDRAPADPVVRMALFFVQIEARGEPAKDAEIDEAWAATAEIVGRELKWSNDERRRICQLVARCQPHRWLGRSATDLRRGLSALDADGRRDISALLKAYSGDPIAELRQQLETIISRGDPLDIGDLEIAGRDLIAELGASPGPALGRTLRALLGEVLEDPARNRKGWLLDRARELLGDAS